MEKLLRTNEIAKICQVSQGTVIRWINEGRLPASSTAGGHNRIRSNDLIELLRNLRLPIPSELEIDQNIRILIVDDEAEIRNMVHWMIEQSFQNVLVEEAKDGFVAGWKAHSFHPDLVLLDLMMPGVDGFHICEFIRQFPGLKETKIIAISALLIDSDVEKKILGLGANDFLTKPFNLDVLKEKIAFHLKGKVKKIPDFKNGSSEKRTQNHGNG